MDRLSLLRPLSLLLPLLLPLLLSLALPLCAHAAEVHVAVAANFAGPMARMAQDFTAATGHKLKLSSGATGRFYAQIVAGAPFDVLLAADDETPARLVREGHAVAGTDFPYAIGRLVLWSAQPGLVDDQGAVLARLDWKHLAIANPRTAPYGRAAMQVLKARGLDPAAAGRVVTGESIAQTYQFVFTRNADLGFVALSQVQWPGQAVVGSQWLVPASLHGEILQSAVLLKAGAKNPAAAALLAWLKGDVARAVMQAHGYGQPGTAR